MPRPVWINGPIGSGTSASTFDYVNVMGETYITLRKQDGGQVAVPTNRVILFAELLNGIPDSKLHQCAAFAKFFLPITDHMNALVEGGIENVVTEESVAQLMKDIFGLDVDVKFKGKTDAQSSDSANETSRETGGL